jgi:hypothetical protein
MVHVIVLFNVVKDYKMGGNALTDGLTRRMSKVEYDERASEVISLASMSEHFVSVEATTTYNEKATFGDCDVIYCTLDDFLVSADIIESIYSPSEINCNGPVISFDFQEMQVDFIHSKKAEFRYCVSYHKFSDLGNLVGKLFHRHGLNMGIRG